MAEIHTLAIICGPTGSGKTGAAMSLAEELPIEIVSADSRQVVKYLDIGTAKPTSDEQRKVKFHLIDLIEPGERYSAFRFLEDADRAIGGILNRAKLPLVVGGTGLYLRALTEGVVATHEAESGAVRSRLEAEMEKQGPEEMHRRLAEIDPAEAERTHANNRVRVIRALEIYELTGSSKTDLSQKATYKRSKYVFQFFCLAPPRAQLYAAINARVDAMLDNGLLKELKGLVEAGWSAGIAKANIIGYKELLELLDDRCSQDQAIAIIKQNSRRYAKRQMTWFRHQADCIFFEEPSGLIEAVKQALV